MALLCAAAYSVITRVGIGVLPGQKFQLYAISDQARGILRGSDVWLAGKRVGGVTDVQFLPVGAHEDAHVVLRLEILTAHAELLRSDSRAQLGTGSRLIGNPVVHLTLGSRSARQLSAGDTIGMLPQFDAEMALARAEQAIFVYPTIVADIREIMSTVSEIDSLLRGILAAADSGGSAPVLQLVSDVAAIGAQFERGTIGALMADTLIGNFVASIRSDLDTVVRRYGLESSVAHEHLVRRGVLSDLDRVAGDLAAAIQSIGARAHELTAGERGAMLRGEFARLRDGLALIRSDVRRNPFRYIIF